MLLMHHYFWDSDTRIYHMLGRRDIRSYVYFVSFILSFILLRVLTTQLVGWHTVLYRLMFMFIGCIALVIFILEMRLDLGGMSCMWSYMVGGLFVD